MSTPTPSDETEATQRWLRLRSLFWRYRTVIAIAAVLVLVLGLWVSYGVYAAPGEETEERLEQRWTATGDFAYEATVPESTAVYDAGTVLEDEPLYYVAVTPIVEGTFDAGYQAETAGDVAVALDVDLVYRSVDPDDETVYWSERERLADANATGVDADEAVTAAFDVDIPAVSDRIDEIEDELEASPGDIEIYLEIDREIDGDQRLASDTVTVPIEYDGSTYRIENQEAYDEVYEEYRTETVTASYGPTRTVGGPVLALLGIVGVAGVALASRMVPRLTAEERAWLEYRTDRETFEEIITPTTLPASAIDGERAEVDSLASLAEFGIDVGQPLVYDERTEQYMIRHDELRYVYEPPSIDGERDTRGPLEEIGGRSAGPIDSFEVQIDPNRGDARSAETATSEAGDPGEDKRVDTADTATVDTESDENPESDRTDSLEFPSDTE